MAPPSSSKSSCSSVLGIAPSFPKISNSGCVSLKASHVATSSLRPVSSYSITLNHFRFNFDMVVVLHTIPKRSWIIQTRSSRKRVRFAGSRSHSLTSLERISAKQDEHGKTGQDIPIPAPHPTLSAAHSSYSDSEACTPCHVARDSVSCGRWNFGRLSDDGGSSSGRNRLRGVLGFALGFGGTVCRRRAWLRRRKCPRCFVDVEGWRKAGLCCRRGGNS